jgi:hypothetical protein
MCCGLTPEEWQELLEGFHLHWNGTAILHADRSWTVKFARETLGEREIQERWLNVLRIHNDPVEVFFRKGLPRSWN